MELDVKDYRGVVRELQFSVVGRLSLQHGEMVPTNIVVKEKPGATWGLKNFKVIPLKGGVYHILLYSQEDQSLVMTKGGG